MLVFFCYGAIDWCIIVACPHLIYLLVDMIYQLSMLDYLCFTIQINILSVQSEYNLGCYWPTNEVSFLCDFPARQTLTSIYCKFRNFREGFIFAKPSRNGQITLPFTNVGKPCPYCKFLTWQICLLMHENKIFAKISKFKVYGFWFYHMTSRLRVK